MFFGGGGKGKNNKTLWSVNGNNNNHNHNHNDDNNIFIQIEPFGWVEEGRPIAFASDVIPRWSWMIRSKCNLAER